MAKASVMVAAFGVGRLGLVVLAHAMVVSVVVQRRRREAGFPGFVPVQTFADRPARLGDDSEKQEHDEAAATHVPIIGRRDGTFNRRKRA